MSKHYLSSAIGITFIILLVSYFFYPAGTLQDGEEINAIITHHIPSVKKSAVPKPYFFAKTDNGVVIKIQDYGQVKVNVGDKVKIKKYKSGVTKLNTYVLVGKY